MRWLFHVVEADRFGWGSDGRYAPPSLASEGFVHCSYRETVRESARLYFPAGTPLRVLAIDPRRLDVKLDVADTPRGPMPHVLGSIPSDAIRVVSFDDVDGYSDVVSGAKIGFAAFDGMTLLDLVGPLDVLSRIASMGFDEDTRCEVFALTRPAGDDTVLDIEVYSACGMKVRADRFRPPLDHFDLLVLPGGPGTRVLEEDPAVRDYLASYPSNRLVATVCTGALLLAAIGRLGGRRATTHHKYLDALRKRGAVVSTERIVDVGQIVTSGGVTSGIDLGLHLVERLAGPEVRAAIARQIEAKD